ncbi:MAG: phosphoglucosamine mutase [Spirochaetae bacterium HGW-Spirochaetae-1]|nr:MAG: phosphoglucosamine mutase [Spirochaetae bacterium HGW-Spirochaetae-1]
MSSTLMKSVSGIRGVVGDSLTPELIVSISSAFARYAGRGNIIIGRDSRPTGQVISDLVSSVLSLCGCNVIDIGIVPTPTVQLMVEEKKAAGGIVISASHNPIEWNAFKLINKSGTFLNSAEIQKFFKYMEDDHSYVKWDKIGTITRDNSASDLHIGKVLNIVNAARIRKKKFSIVLDSVNGAGSIITQTLLAKLGCRTVPLYCEINGRFPRGAEPIPENLTDLSLAVKKNRTDLGFAQDPDADRLAIVDENGNPIGEENTIALVTEHLLSREKGRVVINLSTTKAVEDIAAKYGVKVKRTRVGEINVVDEMRKNGARIGGEGNGGVISPEVHLGRDSLVGIGYILDMMAERNKTLSELVASLPSYVMKKGKVSIRGNAGSATIMTRLQGEFKGEKISTLDGLRIDFVKHEVFKGGWVHLRASNTEPIFRIIAEGKSAVQTAKIYDHFAGMFRK